ncbi:MAG: hypothetical protein KA715_02480 [Xanthomonadaceae bacterium]|nr:hypothetical protein [Xanthomonadaceae bacterium]
MILLLILFLSFTSPNIASAQTCFNPYAYCPLDGSGPMPGGPSNTSQPLNCPFCGPQNNWSQYPFMTPYMPFQQYTPWWAMYGSLSYPNFYYPGAWNMNGGGINGGMYPHGGGVFAAKPNLYIYSKQDTELEVKLNKPKDASWLLAIPSHESKGWKFTAKPYGKLKTKEATYDYLFYDLRGQESHFQNENGFCVSTEELIPKLVNELNNAGFRKASIEDFVDHWTYKTAASERYCVFPQTNKDISSRYELKSSKKITETVRLWFLVVPEEYRKVTKEGRFKGVPTAEWVSPYLNAKRNVATAKDIEAFEWSVCFLAAQEPTQIKAQ